MPQADVIIPVGDRLPPVGREVLAVTARFRCLALVDAAGVWHFAARGEIMNEPVLGWIALAHTDALLPNTPPAPAPDASVVPPPAEPLPADVTSDAPEPNPIRTWLDTELCHRELLRAIPVAIYTCDHRGIVTFCNDAAAHLWGRKPVLGEDHWCGSWKIFRRDGSPLPLADCPMAVALREERAVRGEEIIVQRPDGTHRYVLPHPEPIRNSAGKLVGAVNTLIDLTESNLGQTVLQSLRTGPERSKN